MNVPIHRSCPRGRAAARLGAAALAAALLATLAACEDLTLGGDNTEPAGIEVAAGGNLVFRQLGTGPANGAGVVVARGASTEIQIAFLDREGRAIDLQARGLTLRGAAVISVIAEFEKLSDSHGRVVGRAQGATTITFDIMRGTERRFTAAPVPVVVQ